MTKLFCFGLGYCARALALRLKGRDDWQIAGTATSMEGRNQIADLGFEGHIFDGTSASDAICGAVRDATHGLISIPPGAAGDPVLTWYCDDLARSPNLKWIGYLSTVGVYGDWQGAWVDEETSPRPISERSRRRLEAERAWLNFGEGTGKTIRIFRLAGIYGPGRSSLDKIRAGTAQRIVKPGQVFNRIHVEDIARVLTASMSGTGRHFLYNVADDEPAPPQDVVAFAADLLGVSPPPEIPFGDAKLSRMAASFYAENKRIRNARIKGDLGIELAFPNYREGLKSLIVR